MTTCQICGREIKAGRGLIALHGYQRPGHGWQTQSCYGARHLPFEVSRDRLGQFIDLVRKELTTAQERVAAAHRGELPVHTRQRVPGQPTWVREWQPLPEGEVAAGYQKVKWISHLDSIVRQTQREFDLQQKRYTEWKAPE